MTGKCYTVTLSAYHWLWTLLQRKLLCLVLSSTPDPVLQCPQKAGQHIVVLQLLPEYQSFHTEKYTRVLTLRILCFDQKLPNVFFYAIKRLVYCIYRVSQCISPRRNWDSPTPSLAIECAPPPEPGEGDTLACGSGVGES
jgi:hypothetical protein